MRRELYLIATIVVVFAALGSTSGQPSEKSFNVERPLKREVVWKKDDAKRKGIDICFSYNETGKVSKITIKSNQTDERTKLPNIISNEDVTAIIEEIIPENERGNKIKEFSFTIGSIVVENIIFEKVQISFTAGCQDDICGISYAEIRFSTDAVGHLQL
jgi:hypothetical protein